MVRKVILSYLAVDYRAVFAVLEMRDGQVYKTKEIGTTTREIANSMRDYPLEFTSLSTALTKKPTIEVDVLSKADIINRLECLGRCLNRD